MYLINRMLYRLETEENGILANLFNSDDIIDCEKIVNKFVDGIVEDDDIKRMRNLHAFSFAWRIIRDIRYGLIRTEEQVDDAIEEMKKITHIINNNQ